jgi:YesN/AraC family two-component response regulator
MESVQAGYMDQNLSVDTFTTEFDMSPVYLGRLFKRITNKSVAVQADGA